MKKESKLWQPFYIRLPDEQPFAFAGLWDQWKDTRSCTILTTAPNELMKPLHDRMPVGLCIEGAVNGDLFSSWVEQHLAPTLRLGDVVVMDNFSSHKLRRVVQAVERVGAEVRYLPPYSPDLNPIEMAFSKFKKLLRDGARRTNDALWLLCGQVLDLFTEQECRNYIRHAGYRYS